MYHIGKVMKLIKNREGCIDNSLHAVVDMWDDNRLIFIVHPLLNRTIQENSFVLVRYTAPENTIVRQLDSKEGKQVWELFQEYRQNLNKKIQPLQLEMPVEQVQEFKGMIR